MYYYMRGIVMSLLYSFQLNKVNSYVKVLVIGIDFE